MSFTNQRIIGLIAMSLCAWSLSASEADIMIIDPVGVMADTTLSPRDAGATIDGVGLSAVPTVDNVLTVKHDESPIEGVATDTLTHGGMWLSDGSTDGKGVITFDLGSVMKIDTLYIWNYAELARANDMGTLIDETGRGANAVDVYTTTSLNSDAISGADTFVHSFSFHKAAPSPLISTNITDPSGNRFNADYNTAVDVYTLTTPITAQYIKFNILSNNEGDNYVGLSEVRFALSPEPASLGLLAVGGLMLVRRRRV